jgi:signal transduction histidine kinase
MDVALSSSNHLLNLVTDLIDFSFISGGRFHLNVQEFSIESLLEDIRNDVIPLIKQKGLELIIEDKTDYQRKSPGKDLS